MTFLNTSGEMELSDLDLALIAFLPKEGTTLPDTAIDNLIDHYQSSGPLSGLTAQVAMARMATEAAELINREFNLDITPEEIEELATVIPRTEPAEDYDWLTTADAVWDDDDPHSVGND